MMAHPLLSIRGEMLTYALLLAGTLAVAAYVLAVARAFARGPAWGWAVLLAPPLGVAELVRGRRRWALGALTAAVGTVLLVSVVEVAQDHSRQEPRALTRVSAPADERAPGGPARLSEAPPAVPELPRKTGTGELDLFLVAANGEDGEEPAYGGFVGLDGAGRIVPLDG
jgi:hypothetical protein